MSTRNDELDTLSDAALSEAFAVEVAEWRKITWRRRQIWDAHGIPYTKPDFATSADSVLPFLNSMKNWSSAAYPHARDVQEKHSVCIEFNHVGCATTFARAACIALLRSERAEKGQR